MESIRCREITAALLASVTTSLLAACSQGPTETSAVERAPIINGVPDATAIPAGAFVNGCSAVLIAPRTVITAGHCTPAFVTGCQAAAVAFATGIYFPNADGTATPAAVAARTVAVIGAVAHPSAAPNLTGCSTAVTCQTNSVNCSDFSAGCGVAAGINSITNRGSDLVVAYLGADAPADMVPMQVVVDPSVAGQSPRFVAFPNVANWGATTQPLVTIAGSGSGTQQYGGVPGRDAGITQWVQSTFASFGTTWTGCNSSINTPTMPALRVSAPDLFFPWTDGSGNQRSTVPANYDIAGANNVAAAGGDSGGPVLIGDDGSTYRGQQATALPNPGPSDTYQLNTRYVAGVAEWNNQFTDSAGTHASDTYSATFLLSTSQFLAGALADGDGDTFPDAADPFPTCPSNSDVDGDGICDEEDPCPCDDTQQDPNTTGDADGICGCNPAFCGGVCNSAGWDNCIATYNPGQENCNRDVEISLGLAAQGDACDTAACPFTQMEQTPLRGSIASDGCNSALVNSHCAVTVGTEIRWQGTAFGLPSGTDGTTRFAHCLCNGAHGTAAERVANCQVNAGGGPACPVGQSGIFPTASSSSTQWRAITTSAPVPVTGTVPVGGFDLGKIGSIFDPGAAPGVLGQELATSNYATSGAPVQRTRWQFEKDLASFGISFTPPAGGVTAAVQLTDLADQLQGIGWSQTRKIGGANISGGQADRSAAFYKQDLDPRAHIVPVLPPPFLKPLPPFLFGPLCPNCPLTRPPLFVPPGDPPPSGGDINFVNPYGPLVRDNPGLGAALADALRHAGSGGVDYISPAEGGEWLGAASSTDLGALIDRFTGSVDGVRVQPGAGLVDRVGLGIQGVVGAGDIATFSGRRGELYLFRTLTSGSTQLTTVNTLAASTSQVLVTGVSAGTTLSVTYRLQDDSLYAADRQSNGAVRILRVTRAGVATELGRIDSPGTTRTTIYLAAASDGTLLLTAGGTDTVNPLYLRLQPGASDVRAIGYQLDSRAGRLLTAPIASRTPYVVAKQSSVSPILVTELDLDSFLPLSSVTLPNVQTLFSVRSARDNCAFTTQAVTNDCSLLTSLTLYASRNLLVDDRATTRTAAGVYTANANGGNGVTTIGVDAHVGNLWSKPAATLLDRAIAGFVRSSSTVALRSGAHAGTVLQNVPVNIVPLDQFTLSFPAQTAGNVTLQPPPNPNSSVVLDPGFYATGMIQPRTHVALRTGVYSFTSLDVEPDAIIHTDTSQGPIYVYVQNALIFRGKFLAQAGPRASFFMAVFGTQSITLDAPFVGTLVAPNASLMLATVTAGHVGAFFAKDVELRPQTNVVLEPFNFPWVP